MEKYFFLEIKQLSFDKADKSMCKGIKREICAIKPNEEDQQKGIWTRPEQ